MNSDATTRSRLPAAVASRPAPALDLHARWLGLILDAVHHGVIATDRNGNVRTISASARTLTGLSQKDGMGKPLARILRLIDPETRARLRVPTPRAFIKDRSPRLFGRTLLSTRKCRRILVDASLSGIITPDNHIGGSVLVFNDVSARVAQERIILDRKMIEAIGNLASNMARDFGNYVNLITGHASSIADNLIPQTSAHEEALRILEAASQAGDLTKHLLRIARASSIRNTARTEEVNLGEIIGDAISLTQGTSSDSRISFNIRNLHKMQSAQAESTQLLDCLIHVFQNAMDAMPQGGTITIDAARKREGGKRHLVLMITDTGHGIPREHIEHVFDPFFSTKKSAAAIGLGLTVVKNAVEFWGGSVRIQSLSGNGTTVRISLPQAKTRLHRTAPHRPPAQEETILMADDRQDILTEASGLLKQSGYRVLATDSGEECITLFRKHADEINLTILDVFMPGRNGKDILAEILKVDPTAPVIMISGFSRDYVRSFLQVGAWGFVQKPIDSAQLLSVVRRTLDSRKTDLPAPRRRKEKKK